MNAQKVKEMSLKEETSAAITKAIFPISISGGLFFGVPIGHAVQWATLFYLFLQIGRLIPKYIASYRVWRRRKK